ncbi:SusD/RagB family nutrient-binding outer membrane lipoprotein [Pedobacter sp.]|uniref:SusD/RagB family nutrient-binding outer membrane lipoprotein n=1 Tax=Pedobacter sp. TaxID=1411316 RepID=UPI003D7FB84B
MGLTRTSKPGARGFTAENAAELCSEAISASLAQYGIGAAAISEYKANPAIQYDAADFRKSIGEQKMDCFIRTRIRGFCRMEKT